MKTRYKISIRGRSRRIAVAMAGLLALCVFGGCADSVHDYVARGDLPALNKALAEDARRVDDRDSLGKTPMHFAVSSQRLDAMETLLKHGANLDAADGTGMTPLHVAAMYGCEAEASWLLEHGAALQPLDRFGDTPLHTAALSGQDAIVKLLVAHGADLRQKNGQGFTSLELARREHMEKTAQYIARLMREPKS